MTALVIFEFLEWKSKKWKLKKANLVLLILSFASACFASILGVLLAWNGGYNEDLVFYHRWLSISVSVLLGAALYLKLKGSSANRLLLPGYRALLFVIAGILVYSSHLGGSLTHGKNYLTKYAPAFVKSLLAGEDEKKKTKAQPRKTVKKKTGINFARQIAPILKARCYKCHGDEKQKGELRLDTTEAIRKGSENGPIIVPGKPGDSPFYTLVTLPPDDDDIMPAKGDPLTKAQTELIRKWILQGASFNN